jgi:flagellar motor protein MotB
MGELFIYAAGATLCLWLIILLLPALRDPYWAPAREEDKSPAPDKWRRRAPEQERRPSDRPAEAGWWWSRRRRWSRNQPFASLVVAASGAGFLIFSTLSVGQALSLSSLDDRGGKLAQLTRIAAANERMAEALESPQPGSPSSTRPVTVVSEDLARIAGALEEAGGGDPGIPSQVGPEVLAEDLERIATALERRPDTIASEPQTVKVHWFARLVLAILGVLLFIAAVAVAVSGLMEKRPGKQAMGVVLALASFGLGGLSLLGELHLSPFSGLTIFQKVEVRQVTDGVDAEESDATVNAAPQLLACEGAKVFGSFRPGSYERLQEEERVALEETRQRRELEDWLMTTRPEHLLILGSTDRSEFRDPNARLGNAGLAARRAQAVRRLIADMHLDPRPSITMANTGINMARMTVRNEEAGPESETAREVIICALGAASSGDGA